MGPRRVGRDWIQCVAQVLLLGAAVLALFDTDAFAQIGDSAAFWLPFTTLDDGYVGTEGTNIAVDGAGAIHMTYDITLGYDDGHRPAYYLTCAAACENEANWQRARLSDDVFDIRLQLDPAGHPRVMIYKYAGPNPEDWDLPKIYQYGACDAGCGDAANWTIVPIASALTYDAFRPDWSDDYFAIDAQGHPAIVYGDTSNHDDHGGTFYLACNGVPEAACTDPQNWTEVTLSSAFILDSPELVFDAAGEPSFLGGYFDSVDPSKLVYGECNADCSLGAMTYLYDAGAYIDYSLRLDHAGHPRVVYYSGNASGDVDPNQLYYLWCDADCTTGANWSASNLHTSFGNGWSVDLALDPDDFPRFVYKLGDVGPGYAWCTADCETGAGDWHSEMLEDSAVLQAENPVEGSVDCSISGWTSGHKPSLAIDVQGALRVGFDTKHQYAGTDLRPGHLGEPCPVTTDIPLSRVLLVPEPGATWLAGATLAALGALSRRRGRA